MKLTVFMFICIIILLFLMTFLSAYETYVTYFDHKTKCFDCEKDIVQRCGEHCAWMAQPAKSFDAEREGVAQAGGDITGGFIAKTLKYY